MRIAVLDDWQKVAKACANWNELRERASITFFYEAFLDHATLVEALRPFDILLPMRERTEFDGDLVKALPNLKLIAQTGHGIRHIDIEACRRRGIDVIGSGRYHARETAEYAFGLILAAERGIVVGARRLRAGYFQRGTKLGRRLSALSLGLIGLGNVGRPMAAIANGFGMRVLCWSPHMTDARARAAAAESVPFEELIASSDILSIHVPLCAETRKLIGAREIAAMRTGALLVNTARGPIVDRDALIAALHDGRIRAAIDVFADEPLPRQDPLRKAPNCLLTPHLGFGTRECFEDFYRSSVDGIIAWMEGRPVNRLG